MSPTRFPQILPSSPMLLFSQLGNSRGAQTMLPRYSRHWNIAFSVQGKNPRPRKKHRHKIHSGGMLWGLRSSWMEHTVHLLRPVRGHPDVPIWLLDGGWDRWQKSKLNFFTQFMADIHIKSFSDMGLRYGLNNSGFHRRLQMRHYIQPFDRQSFTTTYVTNTQESRNLKFSVSVQ